jgi:hypothetical protein
VSNLGRAYAVWKLTASSPSGNDKITPESLLEDFGNNAGWGMRLQSCPESRGVQLTGDVRQMGFQESFRPSEMVAIVGAAP